MVEYYVENTTDSLLQCYNLMPSHFTRIDKNKKEEMMERKFFPDDIEIELGDIKPKAKWEYHFNCYFKRIGNDYYPAYQEIFKTPNKLRIFAPGKYRFVRQVVVDKNGKTITMQKAFEVKEAKGKLKEELLDYLKCINYYISVENEKDKIQKFYDPNQPTIVWFMNKYSGSIYSAELFRFIYLDWKNISGSQPSMSIEDETRSEFILMNLYKDVKGNLAGTTNFFKPTGLIVKYFKKYNLIEDEVKYMDEFLRGIADKPAEISDQLIESFKRGYEDSELTNYAREKQKK